ncbi:MAG: glycosyltransferase, partial [Candidatus Omnitrophica bacterium]|nr:glycosyltransferase [Candidatus Omnitrophota bacterium]
SVEGALTQLIKDPQWRGQLVQEAYRHVTNSYSARNMFHQYKQIYEKVFV